MKRPTQRLLLAAAMGALAVGPAGAGTPCPPFLPSCGFSITGKTGVYLKQVAGQKLLHIEAADGGQLKAVGAKALGEHSINSGAVNGAGLYMPHTQEALAGIVQAIRLQWPYADPGPVRIRMIASTAYGPLARPDNTIVVPLGFLERAHSDDEVAWVMAHEFSHLAMRHYVRTAELEQRERRMDTLATVVVTALALSQERAQSSGGTVNFYAVSDPTAQRRVQSTESWQDRFRRMLLLRDSLASRDQEDQADVVGADLAIAAGYAADDGSAQAVDAISADDAAAAKAQQSLTEEFEQIALQSVSAKGVNDAQVGNAKGAGGDFLRNMGLNVGAMLTERTLAYMSKSHRDGSARRKGLASYIAAAYPNLPDRPLRTAWLEKVRLDPEYQAAKLAVSAHDVAEADLVAGDATKAATDLLPAQTTPYGAAPFVLNTQAKIFAGKGDVPTADRLYAQAEAFGGASIVQPVAPTGPAPPKRGGHGRRAARVPPAPAPSPSAGPTITPALNPYLRQSVDGFSDHIDLLASHGLYDKAAEEIAAAQARFGDREPFLPQLIFISLKTNAADTMMAAYGECQETEDEGLIKRCRYAILDDGQKQLLAQMPPAQREKLNRMLTLTSGGMQQASWISRFAPKAPAAAAPLGPSTGGALQN